MAYPPNPLFAHGSPTEVESLSIHYWSNSTIPSPPPSGVAHGDYVRNQRLLAKFRDDLRLINDRYEHIRSRKARVLEKVLYLEQKMGIMHQDPFPELLNPCNSTGSAPSLKSTGPEECGKHIVTAAGLSFIVTLLLVGLFTAVVRLCSGARKSDVRHSDGGGPGYERDPPRHTVNPGFRESHFHVEVSNYLFILDNSDSFSMLFFQPRNSASSEISIIQNENYLPPPPPEDVEQTRTLKMKEWEDGERLRNVYKDKRSLIPPPWFGKTPVGQVNPLISYEHAKIFALVYHQMVLQER